jgi:hypothetical protein
MWRRRREGGREREGRGGSKRERVNARFEAVNLAWPLASTEPLLLCTTYALAGPLAPRESVLL